jgi:hypothetical protein
MKKHKDISEAQFIRDLKTVFPDISKEDIEWHVNLSRQTVVEKTMMNERIKELAMQSGFRNYNGTHLFSPYIEGAELDDELEEFAQLIIKECVAIMREQSYNTSMLMCNPPKSSAVWDACNAIEKKFGVK